MDINLLKELKVQKKYMYMICALLFIGVIVLIGLNLNKQNGRQTDGKNTDKKEALGVGNAAEEVTDNTTKEVTDDAVTDQGTNPIPSIPQEELYSPVNKSFDIVHTSSKDAIRLAKFKKSVEKSFNRGWRPAWYKVAPDLTAEECSKMATSELAKECFSSSVYCRELLISQPKHAFVKMEVFYPCYKELFNRDDLWKGVMEAYPFLSARLYSKSSDTRTSIDALITLQELKYIFRLPKISEQIKGKELLFIRSHLDALKGIRLYMDNDSIPFFSLTAPVALLNQSVYFMRKLSPGAPEIDAICNLKLRKKPRTGESKAFLDASISEIERFLRKNLEGSEGLSKKSVICPFTLTLSSGHFPI